MKIFDLDTITKVLKTIDIIPTIEEAFVAYSSGKAVVPPVGELIFNSPPGDVHIKYGYLTNDDYYAVKIASGFYDNPKINLPSSNGLMLIFSQQTGQPLALILDEGHLTDLRTAVAGAIAAKYLAPRIVKSIGIIGTGIQARLQLLYLKYATCCTDVMVWGRTPENLQHFKNNMQEEGFSIHTTQDMEELTSGCNLIVTTTPSTTPLLWSYQIKPGTHITAIGTDSPHKQELDPHIFAKADLVVADSITQCVDRGDIAHAIKNSIISHDKLIELGNVISRTSPKRTSNEQITVADLTGLAVQDIAIAKVIYLSDKDLRSSLS